MWCYCTYSVHSILEFTHSLYIYIYFNIPILSSVNPFECGALKVVLTTTLTALYFMTSSITLEGGAYCNGKKITVGKASEIGKLVVMNNIGASRDLNFLRHSVAMIQASDIAIA